MNSHIGQTKRFQIGLHFVTDKRWLTKRDFSVVCYIKMFNIGLIAHTSYFINIIIWPNNIACSRPMFI